MMIGGMIKKKNMKKKTEVSGCVDSSVVEHQLRAP